MVVGYLLAGTPPLISSTLLLAMASMLFATSADPPVTQISTASHGVSQVTSSLVRVGMHLHKLWATALCLWRPVASTD